MIMPDVNISFKDWAASLLTDFSTQDVIPMNPNEKEWKNFAKIVANSTSFVAAGVQQPESFADWREWGKLAFSRFG